MSGAEEVITMDEAERRGRYVAAYTRDGEEVRIPVVFTREAGETRESWDAKAVPLVDDPEPRVLKGVIGNFRLLAGTDDDFRGLPLPIPLAD